MTEPIDLYERITAIHRRTVSLTWLAALTGLLALSGCEAGTNSGMGTVRLYLASTGTATMLSDASRVGFEDVQSAKVTVSRAELMPGHVDIEFSPPLTFELVGDDASVPDLDEGVTALLGAVETLGDYEQLRLFWSDAEITVAGQPDLQTFRVPSGEQTGTKVNFGGPINVGMNSTVDLVAILDVEKSFVFQGPPTHPRSVSFKPVIHASTMPVPSIGGTVTLDVGSPPSDPTMVTITAELDAVEVASQEVEIAAGSVEAEYLLRFLPAPTADNPAPVDYVVRASATIGSTTYSATATVQVTAPERVWQDLLLTP